MLGSLLQDYEWSVMFYSRPILTILNKLNTEKSFSCLVTAMKPVAPF